MITLRVSASFVLHGPQFVMHPPYIPHSPFITNNSFITKANKRDIPRKMIFCVGDITSNRDNDVL